MIRRPTLALLAGILAAVVVAAGPGVRPAAAHGPDPRFSGTLWSPDQKVTYTWRSGQVPPDWMQAEIDAGAADVSATRGARAATFGRASGAASLVAYGEPNNCSTGGIACMDRSGAPKSFRMWFRAHGYRFDWGALRWCQAPGSFTDGCFDAENVALDEFGHVEILAHHENLADASDYLDAVVQTIARARPKDGWDAHGLGRCDVARLQLEYDLPSWSSAVSTCLDLATMLGLSASSTSLVQGGSSTFTATLRVATDTSYRALSADPLAGRVVVLQRRSPGTTTWSGYATMTPSSATAGSYVLTVAPGATYDWRAVFVVGTGDGTRPSSSASVTVSVAGCAAAPKLAVVCI